MLFVLLFYQLNVVFDVVWVKDLYIVTRLFMLNVKIHFVVANK